MQWSVSLFRRACGPFSERVENTTIDVRGALELQGVRVESYRVHPGAVLILHGVVRGSVQVLEGGQCWLLGGASGVVENLGGHLVCVGVGLERVRTVAGTTRLLPSTDAVALTVRGDDYVEVPRPLVQRAWSSMTTVRTVRDRPR